ncbi:MAG TPA: AMIN domain-containing protein, partial [Nevskiaceae bacterium]|nr:AMIN domain-containing protein [Nevskiaceae bacterium]
MYKSNKITRNLAAALAMLWLLAAGAQESGGRTLQALDVVGLEGERVLMTLTLSEPAPAPVVFTIDKPARLSLDLPDTHLGLVDRFRKIGIGKALSVAAVEAKGRTRVVVELADPAPYNVKVEGNKILVQLDSGAVATAANAAVSVAPQLAGALLPRGPAITNVDFRRGEKGEGRVVVTLADPKTGVDVNEVGGKVVARFKNAPLSDKQVKRLDVLDFATPVKYVDVQRAGSDTEITVTPAEGADFEQVAYQAGNVFTLELQPLTAEKVEERKKQHPQFTGERVSLSFQSVDIRSLLQIIADVAGTNMVVSDQVNGEIAMRLQNVPWDQALDIILRTKGLGMRQQGNVMLVAPLEELATRDKVELEAQKTNTELAPLRSELIQVNYAKAGELSKLLKGCGTATCATNAKNSILSDRGH